MPRNKAAFTQELSRIFASAQLAATAKSFDPSIVSESDSMSAVITKVSQATSQAFADALAQPLADAIHKYMDDQLIQLTLSTGSGTAKVVG